MFIFLLSANGLSVQAVADHIPQLVQGMRGSQTHPEDLGAQLALIIASQSFLQVPSVYKQTRAMFVLANSYPRDSINVYLLSPNSPVVKW